MDIFNLNIIDVVFVLFIICGGVMGMKRGVFKELVMTVGNVILLVVSIYLKNPIAEFLSLHLPFFNFSGSFEGLVVLNILLYQLIAFILVFAVLSVIFSIILSITKIFEKILDFTVVLGFASKILGLIVGLIEGYIIVFLLSVVLSYPIFNQTIVSGSVLKHKILNSTPLLSNVAKSMTDTVDEVVELSKTDVKDDTDEFNCQVVDIMLEHKLIETDYMEKLIEAGKVNVDGMDEIVEKHK